jgi:hypothetical protein
VKQRDRVDAAVALDVAEAPTGPETTSYQALMMPSMDDTSSGLASCEDA